MILNNTGHEFNNRNYPFKLTFKKGNCEITSACDRLKKHIYL